MISTVCLTGLRPGCCSLIQLCKCMYLRIRNKCLYIKFTYCLDRSIIKEVPSINYRDITIDSKLTWSDHVIRVVTKANSVLGFLQRSLKYCPPEIKAS